MIIAPGHPGAERVAHRRGRFPRAARHAQRLGASGAAARRPIAAAPGMNPAAASDIAGRCAPSHGGGRSARGRRNPARPRSRGCPTPRSFCTCARDRQPEPGCPRRDGIPAGRAHGAARDDRGRGWPLATCTCASDKPPRGSAGLCAGRAARAGLGRYALQPGGGLPPAGDFPARRTLPCRVAPRSAVDRCGQSLRGTLALWVRGAPDAAPPVAARDRDRPAHRERDRLLGGRRQGGARGGAVRAAPRRRASRHHRDPRRPRRSPRRTTAASTARPATSSCSSHDGHRHPRP